MLLDIFLFRIRKILLVDSQIFTKTNNIYAFTMLRNAEIHSIDYLGVWHNITNLVKSIQNRLQSASFVMNHQTFHILKKESLWLFPAKNFSNIEKQSSSCFFETAPFASKRKCLTRKTSTKNIKIVWNEIFSSFKSNITKRNFPVIGKICFLRLSIPFR